MGTVETLLLKLALLFSNFHGVGFRDVILQLGKFLKRLFNHPKSPYILACTATWSQDCRDFFQQITGIDLRPENIVWAPISAFRQRNIRLHLQFTEEPIRIVPKTVVKFLDRDQANSFVVFVNSKQDCIRIH